MAGDAAVAVAARLAARDTDVMLTDARLPTARHVAMVGARRLAGELPPLRRPAALRRSARGAAAAGRLAPGARRVTEALQRATMAHVAPLAAIHAEAFPPREAWGEDAIALQLAMPGVFGLVHPRGGMILARVTEDEAEVLTLAVAPEARRQGVAAPCWPARWRRHASKRRARWCWRSRSATPRRGRCMSAPGLSRPAAGRAIMPMAAMR